MQSPPTIALSSLLASLVLFTSHTASFSQVAAVTVRVRPGCGHDDASTPRRAIVVRAGEVDVGLPGTWGAPIRATRHSVSRGCLPADVGPPPRVEAVTGSVQAACLGSVDGEELEATWQLWQTVVLGQDAAGRIDASGVGESLRALERALGVGGAVQVWADDDVTVDELVAVLDACRAAGITDLVVL